MKKVTQEDKQDFKKIHNMFNSIDDATKIYLMGYVHGLRDKKVLHHAESQKNKGLC